MQETWAASGSSLPLIPSLLVPALISWMNRHANAPQGPSGPGPCFAFVTDHCGLSHLCTSQTLSFEKRPVLHAILFNCPRLAALPSIAVLEWTLDADAFSIAAPPSGLVHKRSRLEEPVLPIRYRSGNRIVPTRVRYLVLTTCRTGWLLVAALKRKPSARRNWSIGTDSKADKHGIARSHI